MDEIECSNIKRITSESTHTAISESERLSEGDYAVYKDDKSDWKWSISDKKDSILIAYIECS